MKPVFTKTTKKFNLVAKLPDDRMKLFVDVDPIPEEVEVKEESPSGGAGQAGKATAVAGAAVAAPSSTTTPPVPPTAGTPEKKKVKHVYHRVERAEILNALSEFLHPDLLHQDVIDDIAAIVSRGESVKERRVAKGKEAEPGSDGKLLYLVKKFTGQGEVTMDEKGFAYFQDLKMFENIVKGTIVGRIYPPKNGVDGKDALGKTISAKAGKAIKPSLDRTISLKGADRAGENYQTLVSEVEGYLVEDQGRLTVKSELVVNGDLDYHLGIIDFIGSVRINGDVMPGFSVKAKTGIHISGSVREASLVCPQGDIVVNGYVFGGPESRFVGGKDVRCSVAQELDAEAAGNIIIEKEAVNCSLKTQASLLVPAGSLIGGKALTVCGAEIKYFGTNPGKQTEVDICSDVEMTTQFTTLAQRISDHERASKLINLHLGPFAEAPAKIENLAPLHREKMEKLLKKREEIGLSLGRLLEKKAEMLQGAHLNKVFRVNILEKIYDGAKIRVGESLFSVEEAITGPITVEYFPETKEFKVGDMKPLECTVSQLKSQATPTK